MSKEDKDKELHIGDVVPMLHKIAKCFDEYLDTKDCTEDLSKAVELMRDIVDDNGMFIRNSNIEPDKTCHDISHSCYPINYVDGKPNCKNCEYYY